jgi:hypothetical protein
LTLPWIHDYSRDMRLSDRKIESLADKIASWMEANADIEILASTGAIRAAIAGEFLEEKQLERQLDEDVDKILEQNEPLMRSQSVDPWVMRKKVRQQLARDRGIVL